MFYVSQILLLLISFSTRTTPEWNFMEPDTSLGISCFVATEKKKSGMIPALISEKKVLLAWN